MVRTRLTRWMWSLALLVALLAWTIHPAAAHPGEPPAPHDLASAWNWDPLLVGGHLLSALVYARGASALGRSRSGSGTARGKLAAFALGWLALCAALISPLDALSEELFAAHMIQHILLMQVAAPLLVLGVSPAILAWGLPRSWRRSLLPRIHAAPGVRPAWTWLTHPLAAWAVHLLVLWLWHTPGLYEAARLNPGLHALEHVSFLGSAVLFWWSVLRLHAAGELIPALFAVFTMAMASGLLGALLTFAATPWYPGQSAAAAAWGLAPLEDQQLAGALMWAPAGFVYLAAAVGMLGARLNAMERDDRSRSEVYENR